MDACLPKPLQATVEVNTLVPKLTRGVSRDVRVETGILRAFRPGGLRPVRRGDHEVSTRRRASRGEASKALSYGALERSIRPRSVHARVSVSVSHWRRAGQCMYFAPESFA